MRRTIELPSYSVGEEIAHAVSHGIGIVLAIVGLTVLVTHARSTATPSTSPLPPSSARL